jgi:carbonic anhydrase
MTHRDDADDALTRLRRFRGEHFGRFESEFRTLVERGQNPRALFIGCSDSRVVPHLLLGADPGDLFVMRNVGAIVPPYGSDQHATGAAIEYAVLALGVRHIAICTHSHCGAMAALYHEPKNGAKHLNGWLEHAREAALPLRESEDVLRRTEQRMVVIGLERLMGYPMVADAVARGDLALHGWHYVIEEGKVLKLDVASGQFRDMLA